MPERLSRNKERAIGLGLVAAAALGGFALGESGHSHSTAVAKPEATEGANATPSSHGEIKPGQTKVIIAPKATPKPKSSPDAPALVSKAEMQVPLTPSGGDYNTAAQAAYDVTNGNSDVTSAEKLLAKIENPTAKILGGHAVQMGIAELAAYNVSNGNSDVTNAEKLYDMITLPDVQSKAKVAIEKGIAELAAYQVINGNTGVAAAKALEAKLTDPELIGQVDKAISQEQSGNAVGASSTWDDLYTHSGASWDDLFTKSSSEWDTLFLHSDEYLDYYNKSS